MKACLDLLDIPLAVVAGAVLLLCVRRLDRAVCVELDGTKLGDVDDVVV